MAEFYLVEALSGQQLGQYQHASFELKSSEFTMETLINTDILFSVSEPEDFYFDNGGGPFNGLIIGYNSGVTFVKTRSQLQYQNKQIRYLAVVARYKNESLKILSADTHIVVNIAPLLVGDNASYISIDELANEAKQFRGQHLIGDVWLAT